MNARHYEREITDNLYPGENFDDAVLMVDVVARARAGEKEAGTAEYDFAVRLLCFVFDPVKTDHFKKQMQELRARYRGISQNRELLAALERSITAELRFAPNIQDVLRQPIERLFEPENEVVGVGAGAPSRSRGR